MLTGSTFALLCAFSFAFGSITVRRAVVKGPAGTEALFITILVTLPFIFSILLATGQVGSIFCFSWSAYIWLAAAGIIHFVFGRWMFFKSVQSLGANITSILRRIDVLVALLFGTAFLHEPVSLTLLVGILLIVIGVVITSLNTNQGGGRLLHLGSLPKALSYGFGTGILWGTTPVMMKVGLQGTDLPIAGAFVSFLAATFALSLTMLSPNKRTALSLMTGKVIGLYCVVGVLSGIANIFRFMALNISPASMVVPLLSTEPVFLLIFSFLLNRKLEVFNLQVAVGSVAVVLGTICLV